MKLLLDCYHWCSKWSASQRWFLVVLSLYWLTVCYWESRKAEKAMNAAQYWREYAITNVVYVKTVYHTNSMHQPGPTGLRPISR